MVRLNRIYTRTGDDGTTGLTGGERRKKYDLRIETFGTVDETNATIGLARLHIIGEHDAILARVQNDLFDLGADLSTPEDTVSPSNSLRLLHTQVERLEQEIDLLNEKLSPLRSFILPGGTPAAAALHLARTVCRRAERLAVALSEEEEISATAICYLNRLSDLLFVLARITNNNGTDDILWRPGENR